MSPTMVRLVSLTRREVSRFMKIPRQTLGAPLLETFLYISVFGAALGSRVGDLDGYSYVVFVIPGLIMMAFAINAFTNNASSILQQKFQRAIDDQLSSPASPGQLLLAFTLGGFFRGLLISMITFAVASLLVDLPVKHLYILFPALFLVGWFFAQLGVFVGVRAEQFDDVSFACLCDPQVQELLSHQDAVLEGKDGGLLLVVNTESGQIDNTLPLNSLPAWDGMAGAKGNLYLSTLDGQVICFRSQP